MVDKRSSHESRRGALKTIGSFCASTALLSSSVQASRASPGREASITDYKALEQKHGKGSITGLSVVADGRAITYEREHVPILRKYLQKASSIQVETIEFEDGYEIKMVSLQDGDDLVHKFDDIEYSYSITSELRSQVQKEVKKSYEEVPSLSEQSPSIQSATQAVTDPDTIYDASGGRADWDEGISVPGYTGLAHATTNRYENKAGVICSARGAAYGVNGWAKVFKNVSFSSPRTLETTFYGDIRGVLSAIASGCYVRGWGYIKNNSTDEVNRCQLFEVTGDFHANGINERYGEWQGTGPNGTNVSEIVEFDEDTSYEVGVHLKMSTTAVSAASSVLNFYPKWGNLDTDAYLDWNFIDFEETQ